LLTHILATITLDHITAAMTLGTIVALVALLCRLPTSTPLMWREERLWNFSASERVHLSNLVIHKGGLKKIPVLTNDAMGY
jgi:hypothetical protein